MVHVQIHDIHCDPAKLLTFVMLSSFMQPQDGDTELTYRPSNIQIVCMDHTANKR